MIRDRCAVPASPSLPTDWWTCVCARVWGEMNSGSLLFYDIGTKLVSSALAGLAACNGRARGSPSAIGRRAPRPPGTSLLHKVIYNSRARERERRLMEYLAN